MHKLPISDWSYGLVYKDRNYMKNNNELDCWLSRVNKILNILKIPDNICYVIDKTIKVRFGRYFLDEINTIIVGADGSDHNMLQLD